jgi:magnesium transporter
MKKNPTKQSHTIGARPGELLFVGEKKKQSVRIELMDFDQNQVKQKVLKRVEDSFPFKGTPTVTWLNIDGLHDTRVIEKAGQHFGLHPLVMEDILNTGQRPKVEDFDDHLFLVLKMLSYDTEKEELVSEQISFILGKDFLLSFQEKEGDVFDSVRERIRTTKSRIRRTAPDYLMYALVDAVVDNYFLILEQLGERVEALEDEVITSPSQQTLERIHRLKRELLYLRKSVWPLREVISLLEHMDTDLIHPDTGIYLKDVYDHTIQVIDNVESYRDMSAGMVESYLSSINNRMSEVMKVLTVFAAIFIPLTFLTGLYGMNFDYMPELHWEYGYLFFWGVTLFSAGLMAYYFKRKKWY